VGTNYRRKPQEKLWKVFYWTTFLNRRIRDDDLRWAHLLAPNESIEERF